jgi:hypothetical protein
MAFVDSAGSEDRRTRGATLLNVAVFTAVAVYYAFLLTNGSFDFFADEALGRLYNHMLERLLHGQFDMDPAVMGREAFLRNGKTYSYFGAFPALLRLPLLLTGGLATVTISRVSCWIALLLCALAQWRALDLVWPRRAAARTAPALYFICLAALLLSGPQLAMNFASWVFNEPILWAAAFAMMFNAIVLRSFVRQRQLDRGELIMLAALAGLAVNTRATTGVGMIAALALILLLVAWSATQSRMAPLGSAARAFILSFVRDRRIVAPVVVLAAGLAVAGIINYGRWGNPVVFADSLAHIQVIENATRAAAIKKGDINLLRVPSGFLYYFFGMNPRAAFPQFAIDYYDGIGWPRGILIATSAATLVLFAFGTADLVGGLRRQPIWAILVAAFIGSFCAFVLTLSIPFLNYRYRMDLLPLIALGAVLGVPRFYRLVVERSGRIAVFAGLTMASILVTHAELLQAKLSSFALSEAERARVAQATEPLSKLFEQEPAPPAPR